MSRQHDSGARIVSSAVHRGFNSQIDVQLHVYLLLGTPWRARQHVRERAWISIRHDSQLFRLSKY